MARMSKAAQERRWAEAQRRCRLSDEALRMARELGLNPSSLIKNIPQAAVEGAGRGVGARDAPTALWQRATAWQANQQVQWWAERQRPISIPGGGHAEAAIQRPTVIDTEGQHPLAGCPWPVRWLVPAVTGSAHAVPQRRPLRW
jgi:hypothetical protein